eukprot:SAG11_NODE_988_length_6275_cov_10.173413_6_plen_201_part_00
MRARIKLLVARRLRTSRSQVRGMMLISEASSHFVPMLLENHQQLGIPFERWSRRELEAKLPYLDLTCYYPPRREKKDAHSRKCLIALEAALVASHARTIFLGIDDPNFGTPNIAGHEVEGALVFPNSGYVTDPMLATQNLQRAAAAYGADFSFGRAVVSIDKQVGFLVLRHLASCRVGLCAAQRFVRCALCGVLLFLLYA